MLHRETPLHEALYLDRDWWLLEKGICCFLENVFSEGSGGVASGDGSANEEISRWLHIVKMQWFNVFAELAALTRKSFKHKLKK